MGFIAQDVAGLLPPNLYGAVVKGDDGYFRLVMTELIAPLVKAVQELDIEMGELRRELAALRGERKGEDGEQRKGQLGDGEVGHNDPVGN